MSSNKTNITIPQLPNIELHITGDWVKVMDLTDNIGKTILKGYNKGSDKVSRLILNIVRRSLQSGRPPSGTHWPPLSQVYNDKLDKKYPGHKIYNVTGLYSRSVGVYKYKNRTIIGLPYNTKPSNSKSNISLIEVAIILEYGNKHTSISSIPARPLWKPSFKAVGGKNRLKKEIMWGIRSQLYLDFGINPKQIKF